MPVWYPRVAMTTTENTNTENGAAAVKDEVVFSARLPRSLADLLDAEAATEQRSRTRQLIRVLEERYGLIGQQSEATS